MRVGHMIGDDAPPEGGAPAPAAPAAPGLLGGWKPSPLVVGGIGAYLLLQTKGAPRLLGLLGLGWAAMHMKPGDMPALQELVRVQLSGCRGCR